MEDIPVKESKAIKWLKLLLKIVVTVVCIWYVSGKIDIDKAGAALQKANWFYLFAAFVLFAISKLFSALRLNIYFSNINIHLSAWQNVKLYWLGMFYNLFLPGSISGDAYKVIFLTKKNNVPYKKTTAAVLLDRFSGLLGLVLILAVYAFLVLKNNLYITMIVAGAVLAVLAFYFIIKFWFKEFIPGFLPTLLLGILVQATQVVCAYLIMTALRIHSHDSELIFIFLVSSVAAVLPLTIGGLGVREVVFLEGSKYFGLVQETSVLISLLFYLITLLTSAIGLFYVFNDPIRGKKKATNTGGLENID